MDLLGREVYLYPFWLERNLKEQDESSPETVYDDFYTRLAVAERLFDWSHDLVRRRSYRVVNGLGIAELEQGLEVYHHKSGILDTVHERWSCLAVRSDGSFLAMEGTGMAGLTHYVILGDPSGIAHGVSLSILEEISESIRNEVIYQTMSRPIWQANMDALTASRIISGEWKNG